jgi:Putative zinc-finger
MNIMNENFCTYVGKRDEILMAYLYDEIGADDRASFDRHLIACAPCRAELDALGGVRSELSRWTPPEPGRVAFSVAPMGGRKSLGAAIREMPAWAQVVAATLFLGVAASLANVEVTYVGGGLTVRTGWRHPAANAGTGVPAAAALNPAAASPAPWRSDLAAVEQDMRKELDARRAAPSTVSASSSEEAVIRRVRQLIQESERRQESELALRVGEVARDMQSQRQADLVKIDRTLGVIQSRTGMEVMRTQRQVNSLALQVSQRP